MKKARIRYVDHLTDSPSGVGSQLQLRMLLALAKVVRFGKFAKKKQGFFAKKQKKGKFPSNFP